MLDLAQLLSDPAVELHAVHLPRPDAQVRWVATSELEDPSPFLEGGELLLTTGLSMRGWRSQWGAYVERLAAVGISGLALGVGLTHTRVPAALVRACEQHGVNLVEVPRETTFVSVSRAAVRLIQKRDEDEARLALETQRQLTTAATRADARRAVTERVAHLVDGAALVVAPDGRVEEGPLGPRDDLVDLGSARAEIARIRSQGLRAASTASDETSTTWVVPVGLRDRPVHYLVVAVPGRATAARRTAVTTAVALLGLTAEQERERGETRRRLWAQMHALLVRGEVDAAVVVGEAAAAPALRGRVQAVHAQGPPDTVGDALERLERTGTLVTLAEGVLKAITSPGRAPRLAEALADDGLVVGVGEATRIGEVAAAIATAELAVGRATSASGVVHWERVVRAGAIGLIDPEVAASFSTSFLAGLDGPQVATLASFLRHHGSRLKVAEELGLHRNTVRNRVEAIEVALGGSLDDPDLRASAWLAVRGRPEHHLSSDG